MNYSWDRHGKATYWSHIVKLIGHLCCTALVFITVFGLAWIASLVFSYLDSIHKFPAEISKLVSKLEVGLIYIDFVLSGFVLLAGVVRFVSDVWDGE
jgi:hypothetical protein